MVRLTDLELAKFLANVRAVNADPHQDYGDVGHIFDELDEHLLLEELVAARKVVVAACLTSHDPGLDEALATYNKLFADRDRQFDHGEREHSYCPLKSE